MPARNYIPGEMICFNLNGRIYGSGNVVTMARDALIVELDAECGDSKSGDKIRVRFGDVIE